MKSFLSYLLIGLLFATVTWGQQTPISKAYSKLKELSLQKPTLGRDTQMILSQIDLSSFYTQGKKMDSARYWVEKTKTLIQSSKWEKGWGYYYRTRGQIFTFELKKDSATADLLKSIQIWEKYKNWRQAGIAYARLGNTLLQDHQYDKSLFYLNKALKIFEDSKDYFSQVNTINYLANTYRSKNDYAGGLNWTRRAIYLVKKHNLNPILIDKDKVATMYLFNNMPDSAFYYFKEAGVDLEKNPEKIADTYTYNRLVEYYLGSSQPQKALKFGELALDYAIKTKQAAFVKSAYEGLYDIHRDLKNYEKALQYYDLNTRLRDSIDKADVSFRVRQLETQYQTQKKETEIERQKALLEANRFTILKNQTKVNLLNNNLLLTQQTVARQTADKKLQDIEFKTKSERQQANIERLKIENALNQQRQTRNLLLAGLGFTALMALFLVYSNRQLRQKNREISTSLLKGQSLERKRVAADLHDNLAAKVAGIRWRLQLVDKSAIKGDDAEIYQSAEDALYEVLGEIRLISHNMMPTLLEKEGLIQAIKSLLTELNSLKKTRFNLQVPDNLGKLEAKIEFELFNVILELTTNILRHAGAKKAEIQLQHTKNQLLLNVTDDGVGFKANESEFGIGMTNIQTRIESLKGKVAYDTPFQGGSHVQVIVPTA